MTVVCQLPAGNTTWHFMTPARHTNRFLIIISIISGMFLCCKNMPVSCGGPFLWGPPFGRTCWTCLNPPLVVLHGDDTVEVFLWIKQQMQNSVNPNSIRWHSTSNHRNLQKLNKTQTSVLSIPTQTQYSRQCAILHLQTTYSSWQCIITSTYFRISPYSLLKMNKLTSLPLPASRIVSK